jgi:hypothetical protein
MAKQIKSYCGNFPENPNQAGAKKKIIIILQKINKPIKIGSASNK